MIARVHAIETASRANGPGVRFVVWLQGCTLACPGCFNPGTHDASGRELEVDDLVAQLAATPTATGLTLSGGEPFQQPDATRQLLAAARRLGRSTLVFSGYTLEELRERDATLLDDLDALIDGRYRSDQRLGTGLRGSANQVVHRLTDRFAHGELEATPTGEVRIAPDGTAVFTGVAPLVLRRAR